MLTRIEGSQLTDEYIAGVPIHRHYGYGETFYPIQGEIAVVGHNGTKTMILKNKNDTYSVVPGEWHRFWNPSATEDIVFDAKVFPAHQGFEKTLHIFYGLVADGRGTKEGFPKSFFHQLMLANMGEVGYPGFMGFVMGLLARVVGFIARATGEEERLTRKYYGSPIDSEQRAKWKVA